VKANEMLGAILLTTVNVAYYQELMAGMRAAIAAGNFTEFCVQTREGWAQGEVRT
jgi:queuine tRNA-ribosyltransferase